MNKCLIDFAFNSFLFIDTQDLADVAHDDIDLSVFSSSSDEQKVRALFVTVYTFCECELSIVRPLWPHHNGCFKLSSLYIYCFRIEFTQLRPVY